MQLSCKAKMYSKVQQIRQEMKRVETVLNRIQSLHLITYILSTYLNAYFGGFIGFDCANKGFDVFF